MPRGEHNRSFFPGLIPSESSIWREWLVGNELEFDRFEYNVRVGPGVNAPPKVLADMPELQERLRVQFLEATRHRIDCVGWEGPAVTIFEVEGRGDTVALGQLLTYQELWFEDHPPTAPVSLRLVARVMGPGMDAVFRRAKIRVDVVGRSDPKNPLRTG